MNESAEQLYLVPGGYPVTIDVAQATVGGAGTALHFTLPLRGHNLPLKHERESKLVTALDGELVVRSGGVAIAVLRQGEAIVLDSHIAHRIHQRGAQPSTVGVALWPGAVEQAFREQAARVTAGAYDHDDMVRIYAAYGVRWDGGGDAAAPAAEVKPLAHWMGSLPPALAAAIAQRWPVR